MEGVRTRLDRIYLDSLNQPSTASVSDDEHDGEVNDLEEELESLYAEILPVAQMSAEQQYLTPARREVAASDGLSQEQSGKAVQYVGVAFWFSALSTDYI